MEKKCPIAEIFTSPQGEGVYAGTMMTFVRLAGCTVGKPYPKEKYAERYSTDTMERPLHLPIYTEKCTLYDGREFPCDTDYRSKEKLTVEEIGERIPNEIGRVCLTGGEPVMHNLMPLIKYIANKGKIIHLETSGTIDIDAGPYPVWITVSPKYGVLKDMILKADELKLLVDDHFNPETLIGESDISLATIARATPTFLHPVNHEHSVDEENLARCVSWQKKYPQFRIGIQLHKAISFYIKEVIR